LTDTTQYDYIIAGTGCAGLSLAMHMIRSGRFSDKKILLIDKQRKDKNDRTWCFWEDRPGFFEEIVYSRWQQAWFHGQHFSRLMELSPYEYKLIRGIDFYNYCFDRISQERNIQIHYGEIQKVHSDTQHAYVILDGKKFQARFVFNSLQLQQPALGKKDHYLLQHFKGWIVETAQPVFDPGQATLMDFRIGQQHGTAFVYLMPFTTNRALVEYTLFTKGLLQPEQYDEALRDYLQHFAKVGEYKIEEEEFGVIPMTDYRFPIADNRIIHIGTAGGQTKASSGYTFRFIQKHSAAIVEQLLRDDQSFIPPPAAASRFRFYDSVLLHILYNNKLPGKDVFTDLFKKNKPQAVLRFLDNESSFGDELRIISSLPAWPFLKAAWKQR
jgi:lycopene beta-cyclase